MGDSSVGRGLGALCSIIIGPGHRDCSLKMIGRGATGILIGLRCLRIPGREYELYSSSAEKRFIGSMGGYRG